MRKSKLINVKGKTESAAELLMQGKEGQKKRETLEKHRQNIRDRKQRYQDLTSGKVKVGGKKKKDRFNDESFGDTSDHAKQNSTSWRQHAGMAHKSHKQRKEGSVVRRVSQVCAVM